MSDLPCMCRPITKSQKSFKTAESSNVSEKDENCSCSCSCSDLSQESTNCTCTKCICIKCPRQIIIPKFCEIVTPMGDATTKNLKQSTCKCKKCECSVCPLRPSEKPKRQSVDKRTTCSSFSYGDVKAFECTSDSCKNRGKPIRKEKEDTKDGCDCFVCINPKKSERSNSMKRTQQLESKKLEKKNSFDCTCEICKNLARLYSFNTKLPCNCVQCVCDPCDDTSMKKELKENKMEKDVNVGDVLTEPTTFQPFKNLLPCNCVECVCNPCIKDAGVVKKEAECTSANCQCYSCHSVNQKKKIEDDKVKVEIVENKQGECTSAKCQCFSCRSMDKKKPIEEDKVKVENVVDKQGECTSAECQCTSCRAIIEKKKEVEDYKIKVEVVEHKQGECTSAECQCFSCRSVDKKKKEIEDDKVKVEVIENKQGECTSAECQCSSCRAINEKKKGIEDDKVKVEVVEHKQGECTSAECQCSSCRTINEKKKGIEDGKVKVEVVEHKQGECTSAECQCFSCRSVDKKKKETEDDKVKVEVVENKQGECTSAECQCSSCRTINEKKKVIEDDKLKVEVVEHKQGECTSAECQCSSCRTINEKKKVIEDDKLKVEVVEHKQGECTSAECQCSSCRAIDKKKKEIENGEVKVVIVENKQVECTSAECQCSSCRATDKKTKEVEDAKVKVKIVENKQVECTSAECQCDSCRLSNKNKKEIEGNNVKVVLIEKKQAECTSAECQCYSCHAIDKSEVNKKQDAIIGATVQCINKACQCEPCPDPTKNEKKPDISQNKCCQCCLCEDTTKVTTAMSEKGIQENQQIRCDCSICKCQPCNDPNVKQQDDVYKCYCAKCVCDPCEDREQQSNAKLGINPDGTVSNASICDCPTCRCSDPRSGAFQENIPCDCPVCTCDPCNDPNIKKAQGDLPGQNNECDCDECNCNPYGNRNIQPSAVNTEMGPVFPKLANCDCVKCICLPCADPNIALQQKSKLDSVHCIPCRCPNLDTVSCDCPVCSCNPCKDPNFAKKKDGGNSVEKGEDYFQDSLNIEKSNRSCHDRNCICRKCISDEQTQVVIDPVKCQCGKCSFFDKEFVDRGVGDGTKTRNDNCICINCDCLNKSKMKASIPTNRKSKDPNCICTVCDCDNQESMKNVNFACMCGDQKTPPFCLCSICSCDNAVEKTPSRSAKKCCCRDCPYDKNRENEKNTICTCSDCSCVVCLDNEESTQKNIGKINKETVNKQQVLYSTYTCPNLSINKKNKSTRNASSPQSNVSKNTNCLLYTCHDIVHKSNFTEMFESPMCTSKMNSKGFVNLQGDSVYINNTPTNPKQKKCKKRDVESMSQDTPAANVAMSSKSRPVSSRKTKTTKPSTYNYIEREIAEKPYDFSETDKLSKIEKNKYKKHLKVFEKAVKKIELTKKRYKNSLAEKRQSILNNSSEFFETISELRVAFKFLRQNCTVGGQVITAVTNQLRRCIGNEAILDMLNNKHETKQSKENCPLSGSNFLSSSIPVMPVLKSERCEPRPASTQSYKYKSSALYTNHTSDSSYKFRSANKEIESKHDITASQQPNDSILDEACSLKRINSTKAVFSGSCSSDKGDFTENTKPAFTNSQEAMATPNSKSAIIHEATKKLRDQLGSTALLNILNQYQTEDLIKNSKNVAIQKDSKPKIESIYCKHAYYSENKDVRIKPFRIITVKKIATNSIFIEWKAPRGDAVTGYEIEINGKTRAKVGSWRTYAVIGSVGFSAIVYISVYAMMGSKRYESPARAIYEVAHSLNSRSVWPIPNK